MAERERSIDEEIASDAQVGITAATGLTEFLLTGGVPIMTALGEMGRRVAELRSRSEMETLRAMAKMLENRIDQIDRPFLETEDFARATAEIFEHVVQSREMDKRNYYAALWSSMATHDRPDQRNFERAVDTLERLRLSHLWLLHEIAGPYDAGWPEVTADSPAQERFLDTYPNVDREILKLDIGDIEREGLVETRMFDGPHGGYRDMRYRLSDHGKRFHQFVILPYTDVHPPK